MTHKQKTPKIIFVLASIAFVFGLLTIKSGGSILFGPQSARSAAGNVVDFVLWFNFSAGFLYIFCGFGLWTQKNWAVSLSGLIALMTLLVFLALGVHIISGGMFENRTVAAMILRLAVWSSLFFLARRFMQKRLANT